MKTTLDTHHHSCATQLLFIIIIILTCTHTVCESVCLRVWLNSHKTHRKWIYNGINLQSLTHTCSLARSLAHSPAPPFVSSSFWKNLNIDRNTNIIIDNEWTIQWIQKHQRRREKIAWMHSPNRTAALGMEMSHVLSISLYVCVRVCLKYQCESRKQ